MGSNSFAKQFLNKYFLDISCHNLKNLYMLSRIRNPANPYIQKVNDHHNSSGLAKCLFAYAIFQPNFSSLS